MWTLENDSAVCGSSTSILALCCHLSQCQQLVGSVHQHHQQQQQQQRQKVCGVALTALTRLQLWQSLDSSDARLQLPIAGSICLPGADPEAWEQLRAMKQLRSPTVVCCEFGTGAQDDHNVWLGGMTQLQELQLDCGSMLLPPASKSWAAAVADLTRLSELHLPATVLLVGGSDLLAPLTQLRELTVDCQGDLDQQYYPEGAQGRAATPPGAVLEVVTAAVAGGKGLLLQELALVVSAQADEWEGLGGLKQQVVDAARAALPGLAVHVVSW